MGESTPGARSWTRAHSRWLAGQAFAHPAHHIVLAEYTRAIEDAEIRLERLTKQITEVVPMWSMAPVVSAYQAMRGVAFMTAVTFVAEICDIRRFEKPRQLMAYLGLVPSESSTGEGQARKSHQSRKSPCAARSDGGSLDVSLSGPEGQVRLCARYRKLIMAGKLNNVVVTAVAREMAAFLWAIGQEVTPVAQNATSKPQREEAPRKLRSSA